MTLTTIHSFNGSDGSHPRARLIQASDGNFYGTTSQGGSGVLNPAGTIFRISAAGQYTNLYTFSFQITGDSPFGGLVEGSDGRLYGTTRGTGAYNGNVFRIGRDGSGFTNLHTFTTFFFGNDAAHPEGELVEYGDGFLYGTTHDDGAGGNGIVFRISPSGVTYTNLHSLTANSSSALLEGTDGNFYVTGYGNAGNYVVRISPSGAVTNLHTFNSSSDGTFPSGALVRGVDGNLYGTASGGGANGAGTVFRMSQGGSFTNLYSFNTANGDGSGPVAALVLGSDGNFYGTAPNGGTNAFGTIFRMRPDGAQTTLYTFGLSGNGAYGPMASLVQGSDGNFYGTTFYGGSNNLGTVFKLTVPLVKPANQITSIELKNTNVVIAITSVAGEKYQLQASESVISGNWSNAADPFTGIGGTLTVTNLEGAMAPQRFYRFQIIP